MQGKEPVAKLGKMSFYGKARDNTEALHLSS
jgi:hypothetical protein